VVNSTKMPVERRRRSRVYLVAGLAAVALIAGGGHAYALTSHGGQTKPLSCKQQYTTWRNGPARAAGQRVMNDLTAIQSASRGANTSQMTYALRALSSDSSALERYPMPACADPAGYWLQSLKYMSASAAMSAARPGTPVMSSAVFMQKAQSLRSKLSAELARTVGIKG
jgi:hypothetical protein